MMGRIGVCQWSVDGRGVETLHQAAVLGFNAMHLDANDLGSDLSLERPEVRADYVQAAQESGVQITGLAPGPLNALGLTSPPGSANALRCRELIRVGIDAAEEMGVPLVFLTSFATGEIKNDDDLARTAEVMAEACAYAQGRPVSLATENTLGLEGNLRLLQAVGCDNLTVLLDTQNPVLWGYDVPEMVDGLWVQLSDQVHVKDGSGGQMGNSLLGAGESGFTATAGRLRAHGFAGTLISENDYLGERQVNAAPDIAAMTAILNIGTDKPQMDTDEHR
jgi:2-epi-5-epi-valiolone 7-phosphate 2-epimerase